MTKLSLSFAGFMGLLLVYGVYFFWLRITKNLFLIDLNFYDRFGVFRFKNKKLLEDPLKLLLTPDYSSTIVEGDGYGIKFITQDDTEGNESMGDGDEDTNVNEEKENKEP